MTTGDSMEGCRSPISDSSKAIAPSYSKRMSTNSCFSAGERKLFPIFMAARRSGVSLEPRGTCRPVVGNVEAGEGGTLLGLMPSGNGTFAGSTFLSFRLYIVLTIALHCLRFKTNSYIFPPKLNCKSSKVSFRTRAVRLLSILGTWSISGA